ncbi:hypothetical protein AB8F75_03260 [Salmonella enterica]|uniref:hypothetical protein n=1 Tax=Salmonella enterica TaxID=28901 RepID=UPI00127026F8|nr:hypothetical protein [Salmonella enterica]EBC9078489.1 hypothetical protein [Salmonella enterica subsp. enterica serovar Schwarzengrund]ECB7398744.1 hypothetical protein [Salmonella enterica subsp. enterica serovar Rissen]EAN9963109.1 hypothetical protein [Salmonella enterica]EBS0013867.1 hypothetical protein [Salmonella enterica subsp. enterica serovar Minnesota]EBS5898730.1 hypothetical protein [Salmonella enterica subsp. enterica serovar Minnesota]
MSAQDIRIHDTQEVKEASGYLEAKADAVVSVGTSIEGEDITTFIFINNYPVVGHVKGELTVTGIEKRRVASISLASNNARKFYESLKSIYESEQQ